MSKIELQEDDNSKRGINSLAIRIVGHFFLLATTLNVINPLSGFEWVDYLTWFSYPIFAFLLAEGFEQSSGKVRYFLRLLVFAFVAEVPYNLLYGGSLLYPKAQNGMFTLCLAYLAIAAINFVNSKTSNLILTLIAIYVYGWGAYYIASRLGCEFASFGVMFVIIFFVSNQIKYPKLFQIAFMLILTFYLTSTAYISFIIGYMQYTIPYRAISVPAFILTWFYQGKRGPNSLMLKIGMYLVYPLILLVAYIAQFLIK